MSNVLKKLETNPLAHFHMWNEIAEYKRAKTDEQIADFYHRMLTKFHDRPLVLSFLYAMIGHSTSSNPDSLIENL